MDKNKLHHVVATAIICKGNHYLIVKRSSKEKNMPNMWSVPGGRIELDDYVKKPKNTPFHWHNVVRYSLERECQEEVGLTIGNLNLVRDLIYINADKIPTLVLSYSAQYILGEVKLNHELTNYAWVKKDELKKYNLIPGLYEEFLMVEAEYSKQKIIDTQCKHE